MQHSIGYYIVDFYCSSEKLIIELYCKIHFIKEKQNVKQLPIVWLSYNVHGNEPAETEVAIATLNILVSCEKEEASKKSAKNEKLLKIYKDRRRLYLT